MADDDVKLVEWYEKKGLKPKAYYLVVGRFVPENNYETMIREFMKSKTKKDFAMVWCVAAPFFIGSISKGRTVRQTIVGGYVFGVGSNTAYSQGNRTANADNQLMIYFQGMKVYVPDGFQVDTLLKLLQTLKKT